MYTDTPQTGIHPDTKMDVQEKKPQPLSLTHKEQKRDIQKERHREGEYQIWKSNGHKEKTSGTNLSTDITNELKLQPIRHPSENFMLWNKRAQSVVYLDVAFKPEDFLIKFLSSHLQFPTITVLHSVS